MDQVRGLIDIIHSDGVHKAGHIFKVPGDVDLNKARRWVDKGMATETIEVPEEAVEADVMAERVSEGTGVSMEVVNELLDEGSEDDQGDEAEEPEDTTGEGGDDSTQDDQDGEPLAIEDMDPDQLKGELDAREIQYHFMTGEKKLRILLANALKAEAEAENDNDEPADGDEV